MLKCLKDISIQLWIYQIYLLKENLGGKLVLGLYQTKFYVLKEENTLLIFDLNSIYLPQIHATTGQIMSNILPDIDGAGTYAEGIWMKIIFNFML